MPESPAIEVQHLGKQYATGKRAVDDVSFTIERGETFALLGPNGAGKSTTVAFSDGTRAAAFSAAGFLVIGLGATLRLRAPRRPDDEDQA
ncbi:hypothetical protein BIV02_11740 [Curtobacterium sp. MMLR14_014]|uniref:ATP-binding cassette domain-containing protein n=1 Tax=unclassified Curtobacterium TaxID=257496 RepID=UPI0008F7E8EF|nr:hypothetical protein BIU91_17290 [Curtobacterium sp. MMLR14_002]OII45634.1 hypothetical protein BIV02_11740 [Curtobacterium sp. MMLR14_014]